MLQFRAAVSALAVAAALLVPTLARAETMPAPKDRLISITASGSVSARPDEASVSIGVSSSARTAKAALDANSALMRPVIDSLKRAGLEDKDIATSEFNLQPAYAYTNDGKPPKLTGYQVSNTVTARVRQIEKLGEILDMVVGEGSNQVSGVRFSVSNAEVLKDQARKAAVANATRMAKTYAEAAGVALGEVQSIIEGVAPSPSPRPVLAQAARGAGPAPIEPGDQLLESQVTMVWAIK